MRSRKLCTRLKIFYIPQTLQGKEDAAKRKSNFTTCHEIKARGRQNRNTNVFAKFKNSQRWGKASWCGSL